MASRCRFRRARLQRANGRFDRDGNKQRPLAPMRKRVHLAVVFLAALLALSTTPTRAQEDFYGNSYITPYPEGDIYRLQAYGDVYAEGLLARLIEAMADDTRVQIQKKHRALPGLIRPDLDDELKVEESNKEPLHIALVMIGAFDRFNMRGQGNQRFILGTDEWRQEYGRRADRLMKTLKKRGAAVYWVGQPIMRVPSVNEQAQTMNDIVREKAYLNGIKYIDITANFADDAGNFAAYGPDLTGKQTLMRDGDGVLFTWAGYRKLAHFVEREIRRDITQARNDRSIPLAGSEVEQKRIAVSRPRPQPEAAWQGTVTPSKDDPPAPQGKTDPGSVPRTPAASIDAAGELKADNTRISLKTVTPGGREEVVSIELPRPAIPAAVVQLITRKDTGERPSQMGDVLADDVGGGLVVLNSVTAAATGPGGPRRVSPGQPYYQVWIKGERLVPRPGRADDFSWPRPDPEIAGLPTPVKLPPRPASKTPPRS
jgi:hypothetical protein